MHRKAATFALQPCGINTFTFKRKPLYHHHLLCSSNTNNLITSIIKLQKANFSSTCNNEQMANNSTSAQRQVQPPKVAVIGLKYTGPRDTEDTILECKTNAIFPNPNTMRYDPQQLSHYDGILMWNYGSLNASDLESIKQLNPQFKGIVRIGTGYDNVDIEAAANLGIVVSNVPEYVLVVL